MEKDKNSDWQRLHTVIRSSHMSVNAFALHIGLPRSENLYQIKKGNHGISKALAETVHRYFPQYSVGWLLSGENPPSIINTYGEEIRKIPVFKTFPRSGDWTNTDPDQYACLGETLTNGAEFGIFNTDLSLSPRIPVGAIILFSPHAGPIVFG